jgi:hypothetical protein
MALQQPNLVDINFLVQFVEKITHFYDFHYQTSKEIRAQIFKLLEEKMSNPEILNTFFSDINMSKMMNIVATFG